jgi:hypothetical protein
MANATTIPKQHLAATKRSVVLRAYSLNTEVWILLWLHMKKGSAILNMEIVLSAEYLWKEGDSKKH